MVQLKLVYKRYRYKAYLPGVRYSDALCVSVYIYVTRNNKNSGVQRWDEMSYFCRIYFAEYLKWACRLNNENVHPIKASQCNLLVLGHFERCKTSPAAVAARPFCCFENCSATS